MLDSIIEKITNPLKLSAGILFARQETIAARDMLERAQKHERDLFAVQRMQSVERAGRTATDADIAAAADDVARAAKRYAKARQALAEAREKFEPRWLERLRPIGADFMARLSEAADSLEVAIQSASDAEAFATANALPITLPLARVPEVRMLVIRLRNLAGGSELK